MTTIVQRAGDPRENVQNRAGGEGDRLPGQSAGKKVLIVDDAPDLVELWSFIIEQLQCCDVIAANDGAEAVEVAKSQRPDLILMDLAMPVMDGYEAARRILSQPDLTGTPIVAVSAHYRPEVANRSLEAAVANLSPSP